MEHNFDRAYQAARKSYEMGRLRDSVWIAAFVSLLVGVVAYFAVGWSALIYLPITLLAWTFSQWRGAWLLKGARCGLLGGLGTLLLPLSVLRPCCGAEAMSKAAIMDGSCCTMPGACALSGLFAGAVVSLLLPFAPSGKRVETIVGFGLGIGSVAALKCSALFWGEVLGLSAGLLLGIGVAELLKVGMARLRTVE